MAWQADLLLLTLLLMANGAPVVAEALCRQRCAWTLDALLARGRGTGRVLFGAHKTLRGIVAALLAAAVGASLLGVSAAFGAAVGALAMVGDLASSLVKRRCGLRAGAQAPGLDQIPESALPTLVAVAVFDLGPWDVAAVVVGFALLESVLSRIWRRAFQARA